MRVSILACVSVDFASSMAGGAAKADRGALGIFGLVVVRGCPAFSAVMALCACRDTAGRRKGALVSAQGTVTITVPSIPQSAQMRVCVVMGIWGTVFI